MKALLGKLLGLFKRRRKAPALVTIDAYCPQCGGMTLLREQPTGRISCPQCG